MAPAQQAPPAAPQFSQVRAPVAGFAQARPMSQLLFAQQALPIAPHASQVRVVPPSPAVAVQASPAPHSFAAVPVQQAPPAVPQATHMAFMPPVQREFGAVQVPPPKPPVAQQP